MLQESNIPAISRRPEMNLHGYRCDGRCIILCRVNRDVSSINTQLAKCRNVLPLCTNEECFNRTFHIKDFGVTGAALYCVELRPLLNRIRGPSYPVLRCFLSASNPCDCTKLGYVNNLRSSNNKLNIVMLRMNVQSSVNVYSFSG